MWSVWFGDLVMNYIKQCSVQSNAFCFFNQQLRFFRKYGLWSNMFLLHTPCILLTLIQNCWRVGNMEIWPQCSPKKEEEKHVWCTEPGGWCLCGGVCWRHHTLNHTCTYTIVLLCQTVKGMWKRLHSHLTWTWTWFVTSKSVFILFTNPYKIV